MDLIAIIVLSIGLSMDSLAIAVTSGAIIGNHNIVNVLKIAGMLAFVQMLLTIIGWYIGSVFAYMIDQYDHWFAFGILSALGIKMVLEGLKNRKGNNENKKPFNPLNIKVMFSLSLAASIDAMAIGLSISLLNHPILTPSIIIGTVTFVMGMIGVFAGGRIGKKYNVLVINVIGGIILIVIGFVILLEHTVFASNGMATLL